ncbi:MAG: GTPase Era [Erysipelotrichia bacterium]|nr:GTPase Era [Erysipelotrichia bacterium]
MSVFKSGFVALIGKPNVGKSTLLNSILSRKVAITTSKPQTTRDNIRGILTTDDMQIIFIDTPGIHKAKAKLNEMMVRHAYESVQDADIILFLIDATKGFDKADEIIADYLKKVNKPKFLIINKIDKLNKSELLNLLMSVQQEQFAEIIPLSGLRKKNIDELINTLKQYLKDDLQYYPGDMISDYPENFMIAEIIREKLMINTSEEIPHSVAVSIDKIEKKKNKIYIQATIVCERDSQKRIIIGEKGQMIKKIGTFARLELEERFNCPVFLETFVIVEENWRNKRYQLQQFGYWNKDENE